MNELIQAIPFSFAALFPVLNPLGSAVVFLTLTLGLPEETTNKLARQVAVNSFVLLVVVLISGSWILQFFGLTIPIIQMAGGTVVAYIGWSLLTQSTTAASGSDKASAVDNALRDPQHIAFFPLTMPITAGPGSIAVTLTIGANAVTQSATTTMMTQIGSIIGILLAAFCVFISFRYANRITRTIGASGTKTIVQLFAFINLCVGMQIIWHGVSALLPPRW